MKLRDINDALADADRALQISGAIAEQTVSGAISTATHGGSIHYGSISDYVEALRIVRADGSVAEVRRGDDAFAAAAVSLGALGVISTVTLRCVPAFSLQGQKSVEHIDHVLANFDRLQHEHSYVDMLYSPLTGDVEVLTIDPPGSPLAPDPEAGRAWRDSRPATPPSAPGSPSPRPSRRPLDRSVDGDRRRCSSTS